MPRFVALLRGVNVGKANRVPMAELRALLSEQGYSGVRTLLNSGNAVFESGGRSCSKHGAGIRTAIAQRLGVDVPVIVKSAREMAAIVAGNELLGIATDPSQLFVAITADPAALERLAPISPLVRPPERWHIGEHAAYLWCASGVLESQAGKALLGKAGREATTRNWATVMKISALLNDSARPAGS